MELRSSRSRSRTPGLFRGSMEKDVVSTGNHVEVVTRTTRSTTTKTIENYAESEAVHSSKPVKMRSKKEGSAQRRTNLTSDYSSEDGEFEVSSTRHIAQNAKNQYLEENQARANGNGEVSAFKVYKEAGEYWNKYPKTDYTYSTHSKDRIEIAPGVVAMPNMSRRSLHKYNSDISTHIRSEKEINTDSYLSKDVDFVGNYSRNSPLKPKTLFTNNNYDDNREYILSRSRSSYRSEKKVTVITRIQTVITMIFFTMFSWVARGYEKQNSWFIWLGQKVHKFVSRVMLFDSWLLQGQNKRVQSILLLGLIPLLIFGGWWLMSGVSQSIIGAYFNSTTASTTLPQVDVISETNHKHNTDARREGNVIIGNGHTTDAATNSGRGNKVTQEKLIEIIQPPSASEIASQLTIEQLRLIAEAVRASINIDEHFDKESVVERIVNSPNFLNVINQYTTTIYLEQLEKFRREEMDRAQGDVTGRDFAAQEAALREAALREAALRETALRETAQREATLRETALREATLRENTLKEAALKEAALKEAALKEAALKEDALKETALKEAALKEAALKEAALKEAALNEASLREAALKEAAVKEAALKEAALREAALKEAAWNEATLGEAALREAVLKESTAREAAERETAAKEAAARAAILQEAALKETALKETALKETALKNAALKEVALKEAALKEAAINEAALKEAALHAGTLREAALKEAALKESALKEAVLKEVALKEAALREADVRVAALKEASRKEASLNEASLKETPLREAAAREAALAGAILTEAAVRELIQKELIEQNLAGKDRSDTQTDDESIKNNKEHNLIINNLRKEINSIRLDLLGLETAREDDISKIISQLRVENAQNNARLAMKVNKCCRSSFVQIESHVMKVLTDILGVPAEYKASQKDISKWLHTVFVAKQDLEAKMSNLTSHLKSQFDGLVENNGRVLMDEISGKISLELTKRIQKLEGRKDAAITGSVKLESVTDEHVRGIVSEVLALYDADKTGLVDYAMEPSGGQILSTRCTESYQSGTAVVSIFGIPLWYTANTPRTIITPGLNPGNCWAFQNFPGFVVIKLMGPIKIDAFSYEHVSRKLIPNGKIDSAPKEFHVYGMDSEDDKDPVLVGEYIYDYHGSPLQFFQAQNAGQTFKIIELRIISNHGNPNYTCLYRFRVHGSLNSEPT